MRNIKSMHLPPQAYTKETLIQAYNWLRSQPHHVQELAKSPDALVALYSKAQMHGDNYLNRPNLQNFKSELKNLANMMGETCDEEPASKPPSVQKNNRPNTPESVTGAVASLVQSASTPQANTPASGPVNGNLVSSVPSSMLPSSPLDSTMGFLNSLSQMPPVLDLKSVLDARSWTMVQEIKNHFNLSSEAEAVRLLIAMGYQKMRSQL